MSEEQSTALDLRFRHVLAALASKNARKVAIMGDEVGYRRKGAIRDLVASLPAGTVVLTGNGQGVFAVAKDAAKERPDLIVPDWHLKGQFSGKWDHDKSRAAALIRSADVIVIFSTLRWDADAYAWAYALWKKKPVFIYGRHGRRVVYDRPRHTQKMKLA